MYSYVLAFLSSLLVLCHLNVSASTDKASDSDLDHPFSYSNNSILHTKHIGDQVNESTVIASLNNEVDETDESNFEDDGLLCLTSYILFRINDSYHQSFFLRKDLPHKKKSVKMCIFNSVFRL